MMLINAILLIAVGFFVSFVFDHTLRAWTKKQIEKESGPGFPAIPYLIFIANCLFVGMGVYKLMEMLGG